jgi:hypothetical protein
MGTFTNGYATLAKPRILAHTKIVTVSIGVAG